jgi:DNA-binding NtrC family response regulator
MEHSTILLLDDDEDILELTKYNLEDTNRVKIYPFRDPIQALRRIHLFGAPDLIVTDLDLPGMHGLAFLDEATRFYPSVKAVIFTGSPESLPHCCRYPVILKRINAFENLIAMVQSMLQERMR